MILTTTNSIEGFKIADYLGIVTGVAINDQTLTSGFSQTKYYQKLQSSVDVVKEKAFQVLTSNAKALGANAVVGIKIEIELTTTNYPMVSITGTAVKILV
ncbi:heavy metal-binding domain-containing protein [Winogradskyella litorisediminis]|uniref:Heavy metal-binding domain-containing protein n=1 Tax=Winogradskyella litorisediminis TaxID=1156618 RepID=A0ABW3N6M0_9FLAO